MKQANLGFTLVELLVGMALIGVVMTALFSFFQQGSQVSLQSSNRSELQQEVLNAQQMIAGKLREAWYIYPPGQAVALTVTNAPTARNPVSGNQFWTTGTHPMLAMILPPRVATASCLTSIDGCYRFLAYYPVLRSVWVSGTVSDSWRNPGDDSANANTWVLAEYRANFPGTFAPTAYPPASLPDVPGNGESNILADYVAPTVPASGFTTTSNAYSMFSYVPASSSLAVPVTGVDFRLATTRRSASTTLRLPSATATYNISVYPTNLGKVVSQ